MSEEEYLGIHVATVDGRSLTRALRRMKRIRGRKMGGGFWRFGNHVSIEWSGMQEAVEGEVYYPLPHGIMVSVGFMRHAVVRLRYSGPTDICWEQGKLWIGNDRVVAVEATGDRVFSLPVDAREDSMLRGILGWSKEDAVQSGYGVELEQIEARLERSMSKATKALAWTGMKEGRLSDMVMKALTEDGKAYKDACQSDTPLRPSPKPTGREVGPLWTSPAEEPHIDLISYKRSGLVFLYRWQYLNQQGLQGPDLQGRMFKALAALGEQNKRLRERAFTVFVGDYCSDLGGYALAITTTNSAVSNFLRGYLPKTGLSGPREGDFPLLSPLFRYDHGYLIQYVEDELAGGTFVDDDDWWGTGKTVYRRGTWPTNSKSKYGKLMNR